MGARNGSYPEIENAVTSWSSNVWIQVTSVTGVGDPTPSPGRLGLAVRPNPFRGSTTVTYFLPEPGNARIDVFDVRGRKVQELAIGAETEGEHRLVWDGHDRNGRRLRPGVFFLRLESGR